MAARSAEQAFEHIDVNGRSEPEAAIPSRLAKTTLSAPLTRGIVAYEACEELCCSSNSARSLEAVGPTKARVQFAGNPNAASAARGNADAGRAHRESHRSYRTIAIRQIDVN